uniref:EGF-like domain-containing protein n=1 Tax=Tetranychus urticae TaxID=32264 RepID=T1KXI9_TETUR
MDNQTDIDVNECDSNPCLNNGTCTDLFKNYTCTCIVGFTGPNCGSINELDKALMNLFHIFIITIVSMVSFSYVDRSFQSIAMPVHNQDEPSTTNSKTDT